MRQLNTGFIRAKTAQPPCNICNPAEDQDAARFGQASFVLLRLSINP
jgi:hypothetical protein